jgi:hypothetical protein
MNAIDLALPDFLRAANRNPPPQTQKRGGETDRTIPKSIGEKPKRQHAIDPAEAEVRNDH